MSLFYPSGLYFDVLNELARWKVVSVKELYTMNSFKITYQMFCRKIKKLEEEGFIKSLVGNNRKKIISLSYKGVGFCSVGTVYDHNDPFLSHDLVCTNVIAKLLRHKAFMSGSSQTIIAGEEIEADGILFCKRGDMTYSIGLEVELTQKSKRRLIEKFVKYSNCQFYNYVLYVFNKKSVFDSYQKTLSQMEVSISQKIMLLLDESLSVDDFSYETSICRYKGLERTFQDLFD